MSKETKEGVQKRNINWFAKNKVMLKFCILFGGMVLIFFSAAQSEYASKTIAVWYPEFIAKTVGIFASAMATFAGKIKNYIPIESVAGYISQASNIRVSTHGQFVQGFSRGEIHRAVFSMRIIYDCSGVFATSIYLAAVLGYPASIIEKVLGCVIGAPFLALVNIVRLVCMFFVGIFFPKLFHFFHVYLWQGIFIIFVIVIWMLWAEFFVSVSKTGKVCEK